MKNRIHLYIITWVWSWSNCAALPTAKARRGIFTARQRALHPAVAGLPGFEIAESFFNSVYCRLFDHRRLLPSGFLSLAPSQSAAFVPSPPAGERLLPRSRLGISADGVISDLPLRLRWQNKSRDIHTSFAI